MVYMRPHYIRKLNQARPLEKTVTIHSTETLEKLQASFDITDWNALTKDLSSIDEIVDVTNAYIKFNEEMLKEKKVIAVYGNNKPWITSSFRKMIIEKRSLYSRNSPNYMVKQIEIDAAIERAKHNYKGKVEKLFHESKMRDAWRGLKMLTGQDQAKKESSLLTEEGSADRLNSFYARFDNKDFSHEHNTLRDKLAKTLLDCPPIEINENDIIRVFSKINTRKAHGPDRIGTLLVKKCIL